MSMRNGTGPRGMGPMTGRGRGFCNPSRISRRGYGYGPGMGRCNFWGDYSISSSDEKTLLENEKAAIEARLNEIGEALENFKED